MAGLTLTNVEKSYGSQKVIHGVDLSIDDGEFVVFVGPSGCGKSTLLRMISGLEETTGGQINIGSDDVTYVEPAERGVAMVFQSYALYPHMTVEQNMGFGLRMTGSPKEVVKERVDKAARILHLDQLLHRTPKQLSGGQRQRVAIGRAIVREPKVFLFDEPLSNLDAELRVQMRLEIAKLHHDLNTTMIYVTHDQVEAMTLADKIVILRDGKIEQVGSPIDLYDNPDNLFVAGFIGSPKMNFVEAVVGTQNASGIDVSVPTFGSTEFKVPVRGTPPPSGTRVSLGVRPEHILNPDDAPIQIGGQINVVEQLGGVSYLYMQTTGGSVITVEQKGHSGSQHGQDVTIGIDPSKCYLFTDQGFRI